MADKEHAYELIDRLPPTELSAIVGLLEAMLDPLARSLANAPMEDEPISEEETRAVTASKARLKNHEPIPHEDVLAEFGLTSEDFERMGRPPRPSQQGPVTMGNKIVWTDPAKADLRAIHQATEPPAEATSSDSGTSNRQISVSASAITASRFHDLGDSILVLAVKHRREAYR